MELAAAHARSLDATATIVDRIRPDQLDNPTPCDGWDVRTLLHHVVEGNLWVVPLVAGETIEQVGDRFAGDLLGADPARAYRHSSSAAGAAFRASGAMQVPVAVSYGPVPGEVYAGHRFIDVLVHGWDLAVATGQDTVLDPALVDACWAVLEPQLDLLKGSGAFATDVEAPDGADPQTRLLAALGRRDPSPS
jgi:uncharacterized protein (TIGR03086 family)